MKRYEIKFDVTRYNLTNLISELQMIYLYPQRKIISTYYDTEYLKYFNDSEEGLLPRKKVRVRNYENDKNFNLEIKETEIDFRKKLVLSNIDEKKVNNLLMKNHKYDEIVSPKLRVIYNRKYFKCKYGRITYDFNINYFDLMLGNFNRVLSQKKILELKNTNLKLKDEFIKNFSLKNVRFSKYCDGISSFKDIKKKQA